MNKTTSRTDVADRHLSPQELADRIGVPLSTIYGWRTKGAGPRGMSIGRHVRYRLSEVEAWEESLIRPKGAV
ncbi:helix-turn-helix transcriptional regulator [Arthrobacter sp. MDT3-44]